MLIRIADIFKSLYRRQQGTSKSGRLSGQAVLEYALLVATITAAFLAMRTILNRGVRSNAALLSEHFSAEALPTETSP